jgi:hypothetical protein
MASNWDHIRNEPVTVQNTTEELAGLSQAAQQAEISGNTLLAEAVHDAINQELDTLDALRKQ